MAQEVYISQRQAIDFDDKVCSASVAASATLTALTFQDTGLTYFRTRTGRRGYLTFVGNSVAAGGDASITFHLYVNGNPIHQPPFNSFQQALGETYNGWSANAVRFQLPENAMIEIRCDNSDSATAYLSYARLRVEYEESR